MASGLTELGYHDSFIAVMNFFDGFYVIPLTGSIHAVFSVINVTPGLQSNHMDPVSISDTTPYFEISQILKSPRSGVKKVRIALKSDRHVGSNFQSDRTILNTNLASLRLCEILQ